MREAVLRFTKRGKAHSARELVVQWQPARSDRDLRWYEWICSIARVLVDDCRQDQRVIASGAGLVALFLFVYWEPGAAQGLPELAFASFCWVFPPCLPPRPLTRCALRSGTRQRQKET